MGIIEAWFPLILCCFLVFFPHATVSQYCSADVCRPGSPGGPGSRASETSTSYRVGRPGSPGAPGWLAKETSQTSSQVNSAAAKLEKQEEAP
ncbi:hypothetical protein GQ457_17G027480 [Hibiscus cannabinus]